MHAIFHDQVYRGYASAHHAELQRSQLELQRRGIPSTAVGLIEGDGKRLQALTRTCHRAVNAKIGILSDVGISKYSVITKLYPKVGCRRGQIM